MEFKISKITKEDIEEVYKLGCSEKDFSADGGENCFWPKNTLLRLADSETDVTLKLVVNDKIVGFCLVMIHPATRKANLENFYVLEEYKYLEKEFYLEVEKGIKENGAEFIAYLYDMKEDYNSKELFNEEGYFQGNAHLWLHKNISFSNPNPNK
ncbi:MAG: hypothetical protein PF569_08830 [Candidatus Woesearchaeota archaeon]|jgi:hypothetical protein|nr:hypothetical protein [Candidatus Woesearchaeota archaeon]